MNYVVGEKLTYLGGSRPLTGEFNYELSNKVLTIFEELESVSVNEWKKIGNKLKRMIDAPSIMIEKKGDTPFPQDNNNNIVINSNHDAVQDDSGRKYFVLDVNPVHHKDFAYYGLFHKTCSNIEVGEAYFSYLMEIDLNGFLPSNFPDTATKSAAKVKRLDNVYQFLKEKYILRRQNIDRTSVTDLYEEYKFFARNDTYKTKCKIDFNKQLSDIGIKHYKSGNTNCYKVSIETLDTIAKKFQWIGELDEYDNGFAQEPIDDTDYKALYLELQKEFDQLNTIVDEKDEEISGLNLLVEELSRELNENENDHILRARNTRVISELKRNTKPDQNPVSDLSCDEVMSCDGATTIDDTIAEPKKKKIVKKIVKKVVKKAAPISNEEIEVQSKSLNYNKDSKNKLLTCLNLFD